MWSCQQYPRACWKSSQNVIVSRWVTNRSTDDKLFDRQKTARHRNSAPSFNAKGLAWFAWKLYSFMAENGVAYHTFPLFKQDGMRLSGEMKLTPLSEVSIQFLKHHVARRETPSVQRLHASRSRYKSTCMFCLNPLLLFSLPSLTFDLFKLFYTCYICDGKCSVIFAKDQFHLIRLQEHSDQRGSWENLQLNGNW